MTDRRSHASHMAQCGPPRSELVIFAAREYQQLEEGGHAWKALA